LHVTKTPNTENWTHPKNEPLTAKTKKEENRMEKTKILDSRPICEILEKTHARPLNATSISCHFCGKPLLTPNGLQEIALKAHTEWKREGVWQQHPIHIHSFGILCLQCGGETEVSITYLRYRPRNGVAAFTTRAATFLTRMDQNRFLDQMRQAAEDAERKAKVEQA